MTDASASSLSLTEIEARWARLLEAAECRIQIELAEFMGVQQSSVAAAKQRGSIPADWQLTLLSKKGINPAWLITGSGPRYLQPVDTPPREVSSPMRETDDWTNRLQDCPAPALVAEMMCRALKLTA